MLAIRRHHRWRLARRRHPGLGRLIRHHNEPNIYPYPSFLEEGCHSDSHRERDRTKKKPHNNRQLIAGRIAASKVAIMARDVFTAAFLHVTRGNSLGVIYGFFSMSS